MAKLKTYNKKTGKWEEMPYFTTPVDEEVIEEIADKKVKELAAYNQVFFQVSTEIVDNVFVVHVSSPIMKTQIKNNVAIVSL